MQENKELDEVFPSEKAKKNKPLSKAIFKILALIITAVFISIYIPHLLDKFMPKDSKEPKSFEQILQGVKENLQIADERMNAIKQVRKNNLQAQENLDYEQTQKRLEILNKQAVEIQKEIQDLKEKAQ